MKPNRKINIGLYMITGLGIAFCLWAAVLAIKQYVFQMQGSGFYFYTTFVIAIFISCQLISQQCQKNKLGQRLYWANLPDRQAGILNLVFWIIAAVLWTTAYMRNYFQHRLVYGEATLMVLAGLVIVTQSIRLAWGAGIYEEGLFLQGKYHSWERLRAYEWRKNNQELVLHIQQRLLFWRHRGRMILEVKPEQKPLIDELLAFHLAKQHE